jgi:hypothetical protein
VVQIARFRGLAISMYYDDHAPSHFHVAWSDSEAEVSIDDGTVLKGRPPPRIRRLIREWCARYRVELRQNWERARAAAPLIRIPPLD